MKTAFSLFIFASYLGYFPVAHAGSSASQASRLLGNGSGVVYSGTAPTVFQYPVAASGACIDSTNENPSSVLSRNGISVRGGPSSGEVRALAKGVGQVERLLGKPLPSGWRTPYNYINTNASGTWNQASNAVNVRRPKGSNKGENVGRLMHELGHKVGNSGIYGQYRNFIQDEQCKITNYATTKSNEQFAEVFAAYVTYPDKLAKSCPRAYLFFTEKLFPNSKQTVATCNNYDRAEQSRWTSSQSDDSDSSSLYHSHDSEQSQDGVR